MPLRSRTDFAPPLTPQENTHGGQQQTAVDPAPLQGGSELMAWGRMDDGFDDHPKVVAMLDRDDPVVAGFAIGLWTLAFTWAHRNTRKRGKIPGLIPPGLPRRWFGPAFREGAALLVAHGLWEDHESGGWMIHDFADYLPTESTREARSEAGKRGAAARWGHRQDAGDAGIDQDSDGNLPSVCHDSDDNALANDGSRAPARRDPTPTPTPTPTTEPPSEVLFGATPEPKKAKRRTPKAATRIPDDFKVTPEMVAWAQEKAPLVNGKWETEQFIDWWKQATRNAEKRDWEAAWRTWMRKAQTDAELRRPMAPVQQDRRNGYPGGYPDRTGVALRDAQPRQSAGSRKFLAAQELGDRLDAGLPAGGAR